MTAIKLEYTAHGTLSPPYKISLSLCVFPEPEIRFRVSKLLPLNYRFSSYVMETVDRASREQICTHAS